MIEYIKELWFGGWQNFYDLKWPVRFFIELAIYAAIVSSVIKVSGLYIMSKQFIIICVYTAKEFVYLIGRRRNWAVELDNKITEWGRNAVEKVGKKKLWTIKFKMIFYLALAALYISTVFVDLPISSYIQGEYLEPLYDVKGYFWQLEGRLSKGYEEYSPLLKKEDPVLIQLNKTGKKGPKIRREPFIEGKIIGKVDGNAVIHYKNALEYDGERYWLKVYLPKERMEGWLNGKLVKEKQVKQLVDESSN